MDVLLTSRRDHVTAGIPFHDGTRDDTRTRVVFRMDRIRASVGMACWAVGYIPLIAESDSMKASYLHSA